MIAAHSPLAVRALASGSETYISPNFAWFAPLSEPFFAIRVSVLRQQSEFYAKTSAPRVYGIAWHKPLDEPRFSTEFNVQFQQSDLFSPSPSTLPPKIGGMAWWRKFDPPTYFKPKQEVERWPQYPWLYSPPPPDLAYTIVVPYNPRLLESPEDHRQIDIPTVPRSLEVP